jgi:hypothetical protein
VAPSCDSQVGAFDPIEEIHNKENIDRDSEGWTVIVTCDQRLSELSSEE